MEVDDEDEEHELKAIEEEKQDDDDEDDEFLQHVLPESSKTGKTLTASSGVDAKQSKLAYTFECPRSHAELLAIFKDVSLNDLPTAVVRVRSLHHPGLQEDNKNKLSDFACALVDHIYYLSNQRPAAPLAIIETLIRHIHSLSRSYATPIATRFRHYLKQIQAKTDLNAGDLTIFTAIGSICMLPIVLIELECTLH